MALYELRTYTLRVGTMAEAVKLYQEIGFPAKRSTAAVRPVALGAAIGERLCNIRRWRERT
jgi:hypothetical protein